MQQVIQNTTAKVIIGFALVVCTFASAQDVTTNFMPGTDFSKYHKSQWVTIEGAAQPNQIVDAQIKTSIDSQLAAKGLTKTDGDNADLFIGYQVSIDQEKQWNAYGMGGGPRWGMGGSMATATSTPISVGTLVLDIYDPSTKNWFGLAVPLNPSNNQEKKQKNLDKAMQKLLNNFPPKQK
jgi:Domain of unknown function (DUF4136)